MLSKILKKECIARAQMHTAFRLRAIVAHMVTNPAIELEAQQRLENKIGRAFAAIESRFKTLREMRLEMLHEFNVPEEEMEWDPNAESWSS